MEYLLSVKLRKGSYDHMINYVSTAEEYIKNCSGVFKTSDGNILRGK